MFQAKRTYKRVSSLLTLKLFTSANRQRLRGRRSGGETGHKRPGLPAATCSGPGDGDAPLRARGGLPGTGYGVGARRSAGCPSPLPAAQTCGSSAGGAGRGAKGKAKEREREGDIPLLTGTFSKRFNNAAILRGIVTLSQH